MDLPGRQSFATEIIRIVGFVSHQQQGLALSVEEIRRLVGPCNDADFAAGLAFAIYCGWLAPRNDRYTLTDSGHAAAGIFGDSSVARSRQ